MTFNLYDLLSQIIPGSIIYFTLLYVYGIEWDKDYMAIATIFAFLFGYFINAISSWIEKFYFWTWGGKPSSNLLSGKNVAYFEFYQGDEVITLLKKEIKKDTASSDELFSIASYVANGVKDTRIEAFNANYAFSRNILTSLIIINVILVGDSSKNINYFLPLTILTILAWYRCKERGYYLSREILQVYLRTQRNTEFDKQL